METSTPHRLNLHRRSLLINTSMVSTPLRKSMGAPATPAVLLEPIDDEAERSIRRSVVTIQRRLTNITATSGSPLSDASAAFDENQIQDHLRICAKLYAENRISSKNAWQLHVIDVMRKIASTNNTNVLQVAGSSLDIGAKIYGLRVDDVHAKGLQLASSMSKSNEKPSNQEDGEPEALETSNTHQKRTRTRKKTKKLASDKRNTIDKDGKTLFASIKHVDAAVFATKENIDISAADNLFTHKLPMDAGSHDFMLLCQTKFWNDNPDKALDNADKLIEIEMPQITHYNLCLPFKEFETGTWDPEEEERLLAETSHLPEAVLDDNGLPIAELDGSVQDIFEDNDNVDVHHSDVEEQEEVFQAQVHGEIAHIVDAVPEENRIQTDYGYNTLVRTSTGKYIDKIWAGPSHWKVKFNRRTTARYSGSTLHPVVKHTRKVKKPQKIDFSDLEGDLCETVEKYVAKRAPPTTTSEKVTFPVPELQISPEYLNQQKAEYIIKPGVKRLNGTVEQQRDYEVPVYNYDNPNDSQYCSQHGSDDMDAEPVHSFEENVPEAAQEQFLEENLVNAPEMVTSTHIPYAMQAKKMDMKKLKAAVWKALTNCADNVSNSKQAQVKETTFSTLYRTLPQLITSDMRKELTCHLAVVALLHLCNENYLELEAKGAKDFTIFKAVEK